MSDRENESPKGRLNNFDESSNCLGPAECAKRLNKFAVGISLWDDFYVEFEPVLSFIINTVIMSVKGFQDATESIDLVVLINLVSESASGTFSTSSLSRF